MADNTADPTTQTAQLQAQQQQAAQLQQQIEQQAIAAAQAQAEALAAAQEVAKAVAAAGINIDAVGLVTDFNQFINKEKKEKSAYDLSGRIEIFSWISCLDLRTLAVLTNSMSGSSEPHDVYFNFLIPEGGNDKLPFYKIKSVLPDSNITVTSQKQIKDKLNVATPKGNFFWSSHNELSSIIIATTQLSRKRYVYISADSVIKGKIEDLARIDLGIYAIGAAEDCSKRVGDYTSMDVLNAVHRTAPKGLASTEPYDKDACLLDIDVLVVEPRNLKRNPIEAIKLWTTGLNLANPRDGIQLAITLAFYDNYLKLPSSWKRANANADILNYDGPKNVCSADGRQHQEQGPGETWRQYLSEKSDAMLST